MVKFLKNRRTSSVGESRSGRSRTVSTDKNVDQVNESIYNSARWVSRLSTIEQKQKRVEVCTMHLKRYRKESESYLKRIKTGDETWFHHFTPESKRQSIH